MNQVKVASAFRDIFPNGDLALFYHYLSFWNGNVDHALWSYGEIRSNEYLKEKKMLTNALKVVQ